MPHSAHLRDASSDDDQRESAEGRYCQKLERTLRGEDKALETYKQFDALSERVGKPLNAGIALSKHWQDTVRDAIAAGLKGLSLPEGFEGYFEIRLAR